MSGDAYYPPPGFHFRVSVMGAGAPAGGGADTDASFREVSGIEARWETEDVAEGGENRFVHRLPRPARYTDLVLRRGVVIRDSFFARWVAESIGSRLLVPVTLRQLVVTLLDEQGQPLVAWSFMNAWPLRWVTAPMDSMSNEVLTESMEFSYQYFERLVPGSGLSGGA